MTLNDIRNKLLILKNKKYVVSQRKGPTGIGHTLEQEIGLKESNLSLPDIGGRVELKATRKRTNSMITLFTFNRGVWKFPQKEIVENYGYIDNKNRQSLYSTVFASSPNNLGFVVRSDYNNNLIKLFHYDSDTVLAEWSVYHLVGKFINKFEKLILVYADNYFDKETQKEMFYFRESFFMKDPSPERFLQAFDNSILVIDIRMHKKESGVIRNHGTGLRIKKPDLIHLFEVKQNLI